MRPLLSAAKRCYCLQDSVDYISRLALLADLQAPGYYLYSMSRDADLLSIFSLFVLQFLLYHTISNLIGFDVFVPSHSCPSL